MADDQNSSGAQPFVPPTGVTLDLSKSVSVDSSAQPQQSAYVPPPGVTLDMTKSVPVAPAATAQTSTQPEAGFAGGFMKPIAETVVGAGNLIGRGAEIILGKPKGSLTATISHPQPLSGTGELGQVAGNVSEWMAGEEGLKALGEIADVSAHVANASKYIKSPAAWAEYLKESPKAAWLLKAIGNVAKSSTEGATVGAAQGGVQGAATDNTAQGAKTGAITGGVGGAVSGVAGEAADAYRRLRVNPFKAFREGASVAQAPAADAVKSAVDEAALKSGVPKPLTLPTGNLIEGSQSILDKPLQSIAAKERVAYKQIDDAVGFDLKEAKLKLKNDQYAIKQLGDTPADKAQAIQLQKAIDDNAKSITIAENKLVQAGLDPKAGDVIHTARMAGEDFKNAIVRATSPDGTIATNKLLNQSKALRFSKRGDRLTQFMGKDAADDYMKALQSAHDDGIAAVKTQQVIKWIGTKALQGAGAALGLTAIGEIGKKVVEHSTQ